MASNSFILLRNNYSQVATAIASILPSRLVHNSKKHTMALSRFTHAVISIVFTSHSHMRKTPQFSFNHLPTNLLTFKLPFFRPQSTMIPILTQFSLSMTAPSTSLWPTISLTITPLLHQLLHHPRHHLHSTLYIPGSPPTPKLPYSCQVSCQNQNRDTYVPPPTVIGLSPPDVQVPSPPFPFTTSVN